GRGRDGRFDITFKGSELRKARPDPPVGRVHGMFALDVVDALSAFESARVGQVAAVAEGHGCDWARVDPQAPAGELALRLVPDVPVSGQILDPDGRPVAGAKVRVMVVSAYAGEDLKGLLEE